MPPAAWCLTGASNILPSLPTLATPRRSARITGLNIYAVLHLSQHQHQHQHQHQCRHVAIQAGSKESNTPPAVSCLTWASNILPSSPTRVTHPRLARTTGLNTAAQTGFKESSMRRAALCLMGASNMLPSMPTLAIPQQSALTTGPQLAASAC
jgi:hypothetical protein